MPGFGGYPFGNGEFGGIQVDFPIIPDTILVQ